jgi:hypothetical protein
MSPGLGLPTLTTAPEREAIKETSTPSVQLSVTRNVAVALVLGGVVVLDDGVAVITMAGGGQSTANCGRVAVGAEPSPEHESAAAKTSVETTGHLSIGASLFPPMRRHLTQSEASVAWWDQGTTYERIDRSLGEPGGGLEGICDKKIPILSHLQRRACLV